jgi:hypothetical protein
MAYRYKSRAAALALAVVVGMPAASAAAQSAGGLDAPFRPRVAPPQRSAAAGPDEEDRAPGLRVMVTGRQHPVASIDGRLVHVGDEVNGMRVVRIDARGVLLEGDDGVSERLTLAPAAQKRPLTAQPGRRE